MPVDYVQIIFRDYYETKTDPNRAKAESGEKLQEELVAAMEGEK